MFMKSSLHNSAAAAEMCFLKGKEQSYCGGLMQQVNPLFRSLPSIRLIKGLHLRFYLTPFKKFNESYGIKIMLDHNRNIFFLLKLK